MDSCVLVDSMCYHALLSSSFSMLRLSQVWPGSPSLRTCSRAVGPRLLHITSFTLRWSKKIRSHLVLFLSQPRNNLFFQEIPVPFNGEWYLGTRSGRCCLLLLRWLTDRAWKLVKKKSVSSFWHLSPQSNITRFFITVMDLTISPQKMLKSQPPVVNVTLFGKRVFADDQVHMKPLRLTPIQYGWHPYKKRKFRHRPRENTIWRWDRNEGNASTSQGMPQLPADHQRLG